MAAIVAPQQLQCLTCGGVYLPVQSDGMAYFHACGPVGLDAQQRLIERPNRRDENLVTDRQGNLAGIKSDGQGVKPAPGSVIQAHPGLTQIFKAIPQEDDD